MADDTTLTTSPTTVYGRGVTARSTRGPPPPPPPPLRAAPPPEEDEPHVRRATADELQAVAGLDRRLMGVERERELAPIFGMGSVHVYDDGARMQGYVATMPTPGPIFFGPAVAQSEDQLIALLRAALRAIGSRPVTLHLPTRFAATIDECYRLGFRLFGLEAFMVRGG